jgi:hypothetical protein
VRRYWQFAIRKTTTIDSELRMAKHAQLSNSWDLSPGIACAKASASQHLRWAKL